MKSTEFETLCDALLQHASEQMWAKGREYCDDDDRHANFKRIAARLGIPVRMVFTVYFLKHVDSVCTWAKTGEWGAEPGIGRWADIINYAQLGHGISEEEREENDGQ